MSKYFHALTEKVSKLLSKFPNVNSSAENIAREFKEAIAPRRADKLLNLQDRLTVFIKRRGLKDDEICAHAKRQFEQMADMTPDKIKRIMATIPIQRLRTYPDDQLRTITSQFLKWEPLVRFLKDYKGDIGNKFAKLYDDLKSKVEKQWPKETSKCSVEDAIHNVILSIREKKSEYTYEGDFLWWLVGVVNNRLKEYWRGPDFDSIDDYADTLSDLKTPESEAEYEDFFQQTQERYLLVATFFRGENNQERVKEIWESMLHDEKETDQELAERVSKQTGQQLNPKNVPTIRRRLRQRFEVVRFILDDVPKGAKDKPGDISVFSRLDGKKLGASEKDEPTVRHLAALARAALGEKTLAWALLVRLFIDKNKTEDQVRSIVLELLQARACPIDRLDVACEWMRNSGHKTIFKNLSKDTNANKVGFFLSPCWYLAVLKEISSEDAIQILRPAENEENWVKSIMNDILRG